MSSKLKRFFSVVLILVFSFSGSPVQAARGKTAPISVFDDEDGPFTKQFYRGRVPQTLDFPAGQLPQIPLPVLPVGEAPSLDISQSEFKDSPYLNEILSIPNDPYYSSKGSLYSGYSQLDDLWGVKLLNAEAAWDFTRGSGVVVAVVDTGVFLQHAELQGNIWFNQREKDGVAGIDDDGNGFVDDVNGWDFVGNDKDPSDLNGHGTHIAGIIGALKDNNKGVTGVAPEADIMAIRVLNSFGGGTFANIAKGIRYAAAMGARVINLSLGGSIVGLPQSDIDLLLSAVRYAHSLGAIVVAAAGNSGGDIAKQVPAKFDEVIAVGALRHQYDTDYGSGPLGRANFSEKGAQLDFMAPGIDILSLAVNASTYAGYKKFYDGTSYYSVADGTSMAAPMVSGAIALLLAQNPLQTFSDIYRRLRFSTTDLGTTGFDNNNGWGAINAFKALSEDYYDNGNIKTRFLAQPDLYDIIRKEYDLSGAVTNQYDKNANRAVFEYFMVTLNVYRVTYYDAQNAVNRTYEFYENGTSIHRRVYPDGDIYWYFANGNLQKFFEASAENTYNYLDEDFFGNSTGRISKILRSDGFYKTFDAYYKGKNFALYQRDYDSNDRIIASRVYDQDGRIVPDGSVLDFYASEVLKKYTNILTGVITVYNDENFYGNLRGRVDRKIFPSGIEYGHAYWADTDKIQNQKLLKNGAIQLTDSYRLSGNLESREYPSGDKHWFFNSGNWSKAFISSTGEYYEYLDENFSGDYIGRISKKILPHGSYYTFGEYWAGTNQAGIVIEYNELNQAVASYEFDSSGYLINKNMFGVHAISTISSIFSNDVKNPKINNQGTIVFVGFDGNDDEIFLYDGILVRQITNNTYADNKDVKIALNSDKIVWSVANKGLFLYANDLRQIVQSWYVRNVEISDNGKYIVYEDTSSSRAPYDIYRIDTSSTNLHTKETFYTTSGVHFPDVNNNGHMVWIDNNNRIILSDGYVNYRLLSSSSYGLSPPRINNNGHVVWSDSSSNKVYLYNGISTSVLASNYWNISNLSINDNNQVAWISGSSYFGSLDVFFYDELQVRNITNNFQSENGLSLNNNGKLVWAVSTGISQYEIYSFDGNLVKKLTGAGVFSYGHPSINDNDAISWNDNHSNVIIAQPNTVLPQGPPTLWGEGIFTTYSSGRLKSRTLNDGAYHKYRDENFYGDNIGRKTLSRDGSGLETRYLSYWGDETSEESLDDTAAVKTAAFYQAGALIKTVEYNSDGLAIRKITLPDGSYTEYYASGNLKTHFKSAEGSTEEYLDENFYGADAEGHGLGRKFKIITADGKETRYVVYHMGTDKSKIIEIYQSGLLTKTIEFAADGLTVIKITLPNGDVSEYYASGNLKSSLIQGTLTEYLDENFYGNDPEGHGRGRVYKITQSDGSMVVFDQYWPGTDKVKTVLNHEEAWKRTFIKQTPHNGNTYGSPNLYGDITGDGSKDLALIQKGYDPARPNDSEVIFIFGGNSAQNSYDLNLPLGLDGQNGFIFRGVTSNITNFSTSSDINGDGYSDIVIQTEKKSFVSGDTTGAAYVIFGRASGFPAVMQPRDLNGENGFAVFDPRTSGLGNSYSYGPADLNGDQKDDLIFRYVDGSGKDETYVVYGKSGGYQASLSLIDLNGNNGFKLKAFQRGRTSYNFYDDVNGDGRNDIIVTIGGYLIPRPNATKVYVIYGAASMPSLIDLTSVDFINQVNFMIEGLSSDNWTFVDSGDDYNGDGINDMFIQPQKTMAGAADGSTNIYIIYGGRPDGASIDVNNLSAADGFVIKSSSAVNGFGYVRQTDFNGDGIADLLLRPSGPFGSDNTKDAYILYGKAGGFSGLTDLDQLNGTEGFIIRAHPQSGTIRVETDIWNPGDLNGDSREDLAISVRGYDVNDPEVFKTYVLFGAEQIAGNIDLTGLTLNGTNGFIIEGVPVKYLPGLGAYGDFNGDGYGDLWIDTTRTGQVDNGSGAIYVIYGVASGFPSVISLTNLDQQIGFKIVKSGNDVGVSHSGDYNNDGFMDFTIGVDLPGHYSPPNYLPERDYYILYGQAKKMPSILDLTIDTQIGTRWEYYLSGNEARVTLPGGEVTEWLDENFYGNNEAGHGQGRLKRRLEADGREIRISEYWFATEKIKSQTTYQSRVFQKAEEFYFSGQLRKLLLPSGGFTTYYEDGVIESTYDPVRGTLKEYFPTGVLFRITESNGDIVEFYLSGNYKKILFRGYLTEYLDENFYGTSPTGSGRITRTVDGFGLETRYIEYWQGKDKVKIKELYQAGVFLKTLEYAEDGVTLVKKTLPGGDFYTYYPSKNIESYFQVITGMVTTYRNENFYGKDAEGFGRGRKSKEIFVDGTETRYTEYWVGSDRIRVKDLYQSGVFLRTLEYTENGTTLIKITLPNSDVYALYSSGNIKSFFESSTQITVSYLDENFYGNDAEGHGQGRKSKVSTADRKETRYLEYHFGTDKAKIAEFYQSGSLVKTVEYATDGITLIRVILPNGEESRFLEYWEGTDHVKIEERYLSGVFVRRIEYFPDGTSVQKITQAGGDMYEYFESGNRKNERIASTGFLTEYRDENFYGADAEGHGRGRVSRTLDLAGKDTRMIEYWSGTDKVKIQELYQSGVLLQTLEFSEDGVTLVKKTLPGGDFYTYYSSMNIESFFQASAGTATTYLNENFYGEDAEGYGQGRKLKETFSDGKETRYTQYWPGTDKVKSKDLYQSGILVKTLEYAVDGTTLVRILLPGGDVYTLYSGGNVESYFKFSVQITTNYLDENFYGNDSDGHGRGRKSKEIFSDGKEIRYVEYWSWTDKVKIKELYQSGVFLSRLEYAQDGITVLKSTSPNGDISTYYASGNLKSVESQGGVTKYLDENFYGADAEGHGRGRISERRIFVGDEEIRYLEYYGGTDKIKIEEQYQAGIFTKRIEYYSDGTTVAKIVLPGGSETGLYESGNLKSVLIGGRLEEYLDENFYGRNAEGFGQGRKTRQVLADGSEIRFLAYWGNTDTPRIKAFYQSGVYIKTVEYDRNGTTERRVVLASGEEYEYYLSGNVKSTLIGGIYQEYLDENFYGQDAEGHGRGRVSRIVQDYSETRYVEYFANKDIAKTVQYYFDGFLLYTETFNKYGQILKRENSDGSYDVYTYHSASGSNVPKMASYRFYNENGVLLYSETYDTKERLTRLLSYFMDGNTRLLVYDQTVTYSGAIGSIKTLSYTYSDETPMRLLFLDEYSEISSAAGIVAKAFKSTQYFYNASGRRFIESLENKTFYYDLNQPGTETLKTYQLSRYELTGSGGSTLRNYSLVADYNSDGSLDDSEERKWQYHSNGRTSRYEVTIVTNGVLSSRKIYTYDTRGRVLETRVFTFYASGNVKTERLEKARITYEYKDEDSSGEGQGRLAKKINTDRTYEIYKYWGETDHVSDIEYFRANGTRYRVEHFDQSLPESSASALEASAFGGSGYLEMLSKKDEQRQTSSSQNPQAGFTVRAVSDL